ncbi:SOS response-associated peptidase [Marinobacterium rhizophilum]|uniref:Abasic site processing protein n=1 Tax=Marinobacterium rhizophilum TaxID=420402 RepID=A0ABY5HNS5_9GAMM|nr:SOS response-associated peptidase [Marinobacterium rhizophilum]UTW12887.1 SOS response-associated peptidase [Marinobacterium rhizophilum]
MCGRYNVIDDPFTQGLLEGLGISRRIHSRYNLAPTEQVPVIRQLEGRNGLEDMRWWLVPHWAREPDTRYAMFNARAETLTRSKAFSGPLKHQRCIVPASSFIEWRTEAGHKQPYCIQPVDDVFAFAGLWEHWGHGRETIHSCTILTTAAVPGMEQIHPRQPLMLPADLHASWLDPTIDGHPLLAQLIPGLPCALEVVPVDPVINNSHHKQAPTAVGPAMFRLEAG